MKKNLKKYGDPFSPPPRVTSPGTRHRKILHPHPVVSLFRGVQHESEADPIAVTLSVYIFGPRPRLRPTARVCGPSDIVRDLN